MICGEKAIDRLIVGDARHMDDVPDASVGLVVTSPPYFAGKEYEEELGEGGVPGDYFEYLDLLRDVFAECVRKLEPGGRIAVNVANLGRRPYRSLSSDVIGILQDDLRLLLRGEIIWLKQRGSSGSCAWGSFQKPVNPVLRDLTERIVVASKGRFDRPKSPVLRFDGNLPFETTMTREDFMENTLDVWEIPPASATQIGHPAPFPVELPARLIDLFTYKGDLVLDPFCGSGTTGVAAVLSGRHYVGYDLDESYINIGESRIVEAREELKRIDGTRRSRVSLTPRVVNSGGLDEDPQISAIREGKSSREIALGLIDRAGFVDIREGQRHVSGLDVSFTAKDQLGNVWLFDIAGGFTSYRSGLARADIFWKAVGKSAVIREAERNYSTGSAQLGLGEVEQDKGLKPFVLMTTGRPSIKSVSNKVLNQLIGPDRLIYAIVDILELSAVGKLTDLYTGKPLLPE